MSSVPWAMPPTVARLLLALATISPVAAQHGGVLSDVANVAMEAITAQKAAAEPESGIATLRGLRDFAGHFGLARTTTLPPEAMKAIKGLQGATAVYQDCKVIPPLVAKTFSMAQCKLNQTETVEVFKMSMHGLLQSVFASGSAEPTFSAAETARMQQVMHRQSHEFCTHPECEEATTALLDHYTACYADALCVAQGASRGSIAFTGCRLALHRLLSSMMELEVRNMCATEPSTRAYCPELGVEMMTQHTSCWMEALQPLKGCSPECLATWQSMKRKYPVCSSMFAQQAVRSMGMQHRILQVMGVGLRRGMLRSQHEICIPLDSSGPHNSPYDHRSHYGGLQTFQV